MSICLSSCIINRILRLKKPNETVIWGYFLYPRRRGEFVDKQYIKMNGKEMLEELIGQLSKVDPGPVNIREKETEIFDSVINNIPVYMPMLLHYLITVQKVIDQKSFLSIQPIWPLQENLLSSLIR